MERNTSFLFYLYISIGIIALILTWSHIPAYMGNGIMNANIDFWKDALLNANPAGSFLAVDILFFAMAGNIWMIVESRRIGLSYVWGYVAIGVFIGISFGFPLYLAMREKHLAHHNTEPATSAIKHTGKLKPYDIIGLMILGIVTLAAGVWTSI
jgi:hypothetical protein